MKKSHLLLLVAYACLTGNIQAQAPNYLWAKSAGGAQYDASLNSAADAGGNIIVVGYFQSPTITFGTTVLSNSGMLDMFVVKYDSSGNVLWAKSSGGTSRDQGWGCSTDTSGNIYVSGAFQSTSITFGTTVLSNAGNFDMFIVKYDPAGNVIWAKSAGGTLEERNNSCSADAGGNIIVSGYFESPTITFGTNVLTNSGDDDIYIVKYDSGGNLLWSKSAGGAAKDWGISCTADPNGNIISTGYFRSPSITFGTTVLTNASVGFSDLFIVKYDSSGNVLWAKSEGGIGPESGLGCCTDAGGNIFVTGWFGSDSIHFGTTTRYNAGIFDMFLVKYDPGGNVVWAQSEGGTSTDMGYQCSVDAGGNILLSGYFDSPTMSFGSLSMTSAGFSDVFIGKYDAVGNRLWAKSAGGNEYDQGYSCSISAGGNVYVAGYFESPAITFGTTVLSNPNGSAMFVARLDTTLVTGVDAVLPDLLAGGSFSDAGVLVFPNPAATHFTIALEGAARKAEVVVTDMTGKIMYTALMRGIQNAEVDVKDFVNGVYVLQIQTNDLIATKRLVVAK